MLNIVKIPNFISELTSDSLIKLLVLLLSGGLLFGVGVFGFYFIHFNAGLSGDQEVWGQFGDFIGGTLNPILAFFTFMALLLTIIIQNRELSNSTEELRKSAEAANKQSKYRESEAVRADIYRLIEKISQRINKNYNENRLDEEHSLHAVIAEHGDVSPRLSAIDFYKLCQDKKTKSYRTLKWIEGDLLRLKQYLEQYEVASKSLEFRSPIKYFFMNEFEELVCFLHQYGLIGPEVRDYFCSVDSYVALNKDE